MNPLLPVLPLLIAVSSVCLAQAVNQPASVGETSAIPAAAYAPSGVAWQTVRDAQPRGLHLTLRLPKVVYFAGETIPATLVFSNDSKDHYYTWIGTYDRSGRISDIAFHATAEDRTFVDDPLNYYESHFILMGGGLGNDQNLGTWTVTLAANQWLRFEKAGKYKLYASASRVRPGNKDDFREKAPPVVDVVSDPVEITIEALSAEREQTTIHEAVRKANGAPYHRRDDPAFAAIQQLRFLQTPAAFDALLPFIDSPYGFEANLAFYSSKDYAASASRILAEVREGRLGMSPNLVSLFTGLKTGTNWVLTIPGTAAPKSPAPQEEIYAAARRGLSPDGSGDTYFVNLLTLFRADPQELKIRALMTRRQLDLPPKQIDDVLREKGLLEDKDFLPLLRKLTSPERHNPFALAAMVKIAPEEARPIVLAEIERPKPIFVPTDHVFRADMDLFAVTGLPDKEIPALEAILRKKLDQPEHHSDSLEIALVLIERYATNALLPDVKAIYLPREGKWACTLQGEMLRYWIRCDRAEGVAALARALTRNGEHDTACYHNVLTEVLQKNWVDEALPVVLDATKNDSVEVIRSAADVLAMHAGQVAVEPLIAAAENLTSRPVPADPSMRNQHLYAPKEIAHHLLRNERWKLTRTQLERLQKIPLEQYQQEQLKKRLAELP